MSIESWGNGQFLEVRYNDGATAFFQGYDAMLVLSMLEAHGERFVYEHCREYALECATAGPSVLN